MRLYNPTPERIDAGYDGRKYRIDPGHYIDVNQETGNHVYAGNLQMGIVDLTIPENVNKKNLQKFIVEKSAEGLDRYISRCHMVIESFIQLDIEMKQNNQHGTALKDKSLKNVTHNLEIATRMVKDFETKFGVAIKKADIEQRTGDLMASIDSLLTEFEADVDRQEKSVKQQKEVDDLVAKMIPENVKNFALTAHL